MRQTGALWTELRFLFAISGILLAPSFAECQLPPPTPPIPTQVESPTAPSGQPGTRQESGGQGQQPRQTAPPEQDFTDNVDQTKHNRKSECRTRLAPGVSVRADRPLGNFSLAYAPEFFFPRNSIGELAVNQNLTGRAALFPTRSE